MIPKIERLSRVYELQGFPYGLKHIVSPSWLLLSSENRPWCDYQTAPPSTPLESLPTIPIAPSIFSPSELLTTPKTTPPPLTSPPPTPTQPSKQSSPLTINLDPVELIFSTPPTSPRPLFDSLKDLTPWTTNPPPPHPLFDSIERLANQPPPVLDVMETSLPPLPPQLSLMWSNDILPPLPHETFCEHCQRTQVIVNDLRDELRFILNHILERLTTLAHQNFP
nr:hypothetical protein [Tanacetum cinerariifolium]GEX32322.1 hypothetical protein [Tanacetum cinerariifolium]